MSESGPTITERREVLNVGPVRWSLCEFDGGKRFMLTADADGTTFTVHFEAEQWSAFQALVVPSVLEVEADTEGKS